ncbi:hypothetical protein H8S90_16060 [Olivibacter sp. SDN3]|uniref:hypothetical protein n=1 Tax=Olivibacter sp. SDN3 TaxID=2764720 RepID=UPI00165116A7|nr:hypothetical protein [Olivibacter sp. SDN3]QNL48303.1 hypothetical protein H8S90_16060 [Olivibacter sp. SDN3]
MKTTAVNNKIAELHRRKVQRDRLLDTISNLDKFEVELREAGLFFAKKKQAWYYRSDMFKVRAGSNMSLDEIKVWVQGHQTRQPKTHISSLINLFT